MNRDLLFGGPAPTGASMPVDAGWAKRQEILGLPTNTAIPPTISASTAATGTAASKRDAMWEAKRAKRLQQAGGVEPSAPPLGAGPSQPFSSAVPSSLHIGVPTYSAPMDTRPAFGSMGGDGAFPPPQVAPVSPIAAPASSGFSSGYLSAPQSGYSQPIAAPSAAPTQSHAPQSACYSQSSSSGPVSSSAAMQTPYFQASAPQAASTPTYATAQATASMTPSSGFAPQPAAPSSSALPRATSKDEYAASLEAQIADKKRREQESRARGRAEAQAHQGVLRSDGDPGRRIDPRKDASASDPSAVWNAAAPLSSYSSNPPSSNPSYIPSPLPAPEPRFNRAAAAAEYAKELDHQLAQKKQEEAWKKEQERALAQQSAGIGDILGGARSHERIMIQVHQRSRSKERVPAAESGDSLDAFQRSQMDAARHRPISASAVPQSYSYVPQPHSQYAPETARRNSGGPSILSNAGYRSMDHAAPPDAFGDFRRVQSAQPARPSPPAPWDKAENPSVKVVEVVNREAYAEDLRRQMAEREDRKRREKAIHLAPAFIPSSRHAGRREEASSRNAYLSAVGATSPPVYHEPAPPDMSAAWQQARPTAYNADAYYAPAPPISSGPGPASSPSFHQPPYAAAQVQQQHSYGGSIAPGAHYAPLSAREYANPVPGFPAVEGGIPAAKRLEEQRKRDLYAMELENQIRETRARKEEEKWRRRREDDEVTGFAQPEISRDAYPGKLNDVWNPEPQWAPMELKPNSFGRAQSDLRPGLEPELAVRKARLQQEAASALEAQIQDKARRKREEAEKRAAEEAEEEERLARERALLARRFEEEEQAKKAAQEDETRRALEAQIEAKRRLKEAELAKERLEMEKDEARFQKQQVELKAAFDRENGVQEESGPSQALVALSPDMQASPKPVGAGNRADLFGPPTGSASPELNSAPLPVTQYAPQPPYQPAMPPMTLGPAAGMPMVMQMPMMAPQWPVAQIVAAPGYVPLGGYQYIQPAMQTAVQPWGQPVAGFPSNAEERPATSQTRNRLQQHEEELAKLRAELALVRQQAADVEFVDAMEQKVRLGLEGFSEPSPRVSLTPRQLFDRYMGQDLPVKGSHSPTMPRTFSRQLDDPLLMSMQGESRFLMPGPTTGAGDLTAVDREEAIVADNLFLPGSSTFQPGASFRGISEADEEEQVDGGQVREAALDAKVSRAGTPDERNRHSPPPEAFPVSTSPSQYSVAVSPSRPAASEATASPKTSAFNPEEDVISAIDGLLNDTLPSNSKHLAFQSATQQLNAMYPPHQQAVSPGYPGHRAVNSISPQDQSLLDASFAPADFMRISSMLPTNLGPQRRGVREDLSNPPLGYSAPKPAGPILNREPVRPPSMQSVPSITPSEAHPSSQFRKQVEQHAYSMVAARDVDRDRGRGVTWEDDESRSASDTSAESSSTEGHSRRNHKKERRSRSHRSRRSSSSDSATDASSYSSDSRDKRNRRKSKDKRGRKHSKSPKREARSERSRHSKRATKRKSAEDPPPVEVGNSMPRPEPLGFLPSQGGGPVVLQRGTPDRVRRELGHLAGRLDGDTRWL